jgi:hypothetical protein
MNGYIDEARIYDMALTASEVAALYALGPDLLVRPPSGTLISFF